MENSNIFTEFDEKRYRTHLEEQIAFLQNSAIQFDEGNHFEAKRMAVTIRVLIYDGGKGTSLLGQMRLSKKMRFLSTAIRFDEKNLLTQQCLLQMVVDDKSARFEPVLKDGVGRLLKLNEWKNEIVICDLNRRTYTRWDLINLLANKDGGAHVDKNIDDKLLPLKDPTISGWYIRDDAGKEIPVKNDIVYCSMRQMTFEMLKSLYRIKPANFKNKYF